MFHNDLESLTGALNGSLGTLSSYSGRFFWTCGGGWKLQNPRDGVLFNCTSKAELMDKIRQLMSLGKSGPVTAMWDWINDTVTGRDS